MRLWKVGLSVMSGILIFAYLMNFIINGSIYNDIIEVVTPSMFYSGVLIIVLSVAALCAVMINCTSRIIKEVKNK